MAETEGFEPIGPGFAGAVLARGVARSARRRAKNRGFEWSDIEAGGDGGIRTLDTPLERITV